MTEIDWKDQHGDGGYIVFGREEVLEYSPPLSGEPPLDDDVVAVFEVTPACGAITYPVYLPRSIAEAIFSALTKALAPAAGEYWDVYACKCTHQERSGLWNIAPKDMICPRCETEVRPMRVVPFDPERCHGRRGHG